MQMEYIPLQDFLMMYIMPRNNLHSWMIGQMPSHSLHPVLFQLHSHQSYKCNQIVWLQQIYSQGQLTCHLLYKHKNNSSRISGHGGANPGATYNGRKESEDALALTLAVGSILEENGVDVYYTRTTDIYESPYQKAQEGNEVGGDYFVSIHRNSSPYPNQYSGVESLVYNRYGAAARMAYNINAGLEQVGFVNLGVNERPNLVVLNSTNMPAVLIEVGFILSLIHI